MRRVTASFLLATLTLTGTQFACATDSTDARETRVVNYADLDLTTTQATKALYGRLSSAAELVCKPLDQAAPLMVVRYRACVTTALSSAVQDVDSALLTKYYAERNGGAHPVTVASAK